MVSPRTETGGSPEGTHNPIEQLLKFMAELLLAKLKRQITEHEYNADAQGTLGSKLKGARELVDQIRASGDPNEQKDLLAEVGKIYKEISTEKQAFQKTRDAANKDQLKDLSQTLVRDKGQNKDEHLEMRRNVGGEQLSRADEVSEIENEPDEAIKKERVQTKTYEYGAESSEDKKATRTLDSGFDEEVRELLREVGEIERRDPDLEGVSGLFKVDPKAKEVKDELDEYLRIFGETVRDYPEAAVKNYDRAKQVVFERGKDLGDGGYFEMLQRIDDLEKSNKTVIAGVHAGINVKKGWIDSPEQVYARRKALEELAKQMAQGSITAEEAFRREQELDAGMSPEQFARFMNGGRRVRGGSGGFIGEMPPVPEDFFGGEEHGFDGEGKQLRYMSPDYYYQQAETEAERIYGELSPTSYKFLVDQLVAGVLAGDAPTHDYVNQAAKLMLENLFNSEKALTRFGLTVPLRDEIKDEVMGVLAMHDFGIVQLGRANTEQLWQYSKRVGMDNWINSEKYSMKVDVAYRAVGGEVDREVTLSTEEMNQLAMRDYWSKRLLSSIPAERGEARRDMALYAIASKLDGWVDVINPRTGLVDFNKLQVDASDPSVFKVKMVGGSEVIIRGMNAYKLNGNKEFVGVDELVQRTVGLAAFAEKSRHASQRFYYKDPLFIGNVNDSDRKTKDNRYAFMFGIPAHNKLFEATDPRRRDLVSEVFSKAIRPLAIQMARAQGMKPGDLEAYLGYMMKSSDNWLMTSEVMLENWDQLMVDRKVQDSGGNWVDRFDLLPESQRKQAKELARNFFDKGTNIDWTAMIAHFSGRDEVDVRSSGMPTKGPEGFRNFIFYFNDSKLLQTNQVWEELAETDRTGKRTGLWVDDMDKHFDYSNRIAKGFSARLAFAQDPKFENLDALLTKSGNYDHMNRMGLQDVSLATHEELHNLTEFQLIAEYFETDENNALKIKGFNAEGRPIYESKKTILENVGRKYEVRGRPAWVRENEIDQLLARRIIDHEGWVKLRQRRLENFLGVPLFGFDPFGWAKDVQGLQWLSHRWRIGPGPMMAWLKVELSKIDKRKLVEEVSAGWWEQFSKIAQEQASIS